MNRVTTNLGEWRNFCGMHGRHRSESTVQLALGFAPAPSPSEESDAPIAETGMLPSMTRLGSAAVVCASLASAALAGGKGPRPGCCFPGGPPGYGPPVVHPAAVYGYYPTNWSRPWASTPPPPAVEERSAPPAVELTPKAPPMPPPPAPEEKAKPRPLTPPPEVEPLPPPRKLKETGGDGPLLPPLVPVDYPPAGK
jgi:hypothetical protein